MHVNRDTFKVFTRQRILSEARNSEKKQVRKNDIPGEAAILNLYATSIQKKEFQQFPDNSGICHTSLKMSPYHCSHLPTLRNIFGAFRINIGYEVLLTARTGFASESRSFRISCPLEPYMRPAGSVVFIKGLNHLRSLRQPTMWET